MLNFAFLFMITLLINSTLAKKYIWRRNIASPLITPKVSSSYMYDKNNNANTASNDHSLLSSQKQLFKDEYNIENVKTEEQRLLYHLLNHYERATRPVRNSSSTVRVKLGMTLTNIFDLVSIINNFVYSQNNLSEEINKLKNL